MPLSLNLPAEWNDVFVTLDKGDRALLLDGRQCFLECSPVVVEQIVLNNGRAVLGYHF